MAGDSDAKTLFQKGVRAIKDGSNPDQGRRWLVESLRADPENDAAWVWLAQAVDDPRKKLDCINHALAINPANRYALDAKQRLDSGWKLEQATPVPAFTPAVPAKKSAMTRTQEMRLRSGDLGALLETSSLNKGDLIEKMVLALAAIGLAVVMFIASRATAGDKSNISTLLLVGSVIPLLGLPVFIYLIMRSYGLEVKVYEQGIRRTQGRQNQSWRWDDFTAVRVADKTLVMRKYGAPVYETNTYTCRLMIGDKVVLRIDKDLKNCREIGRRVLEKTTPVIFARNYEAHRSGETVQYGNVRVNRDGIHEGRRSVAWDDIAAWEVNQGWLIIDKHSRGKFRVQVVDMPNAYVLLAMIDKIKGNRY